MVANRIQEQLEQLFPARVQLGSTVSDAFVPCPMFGLITSQQQSQIVEIYKLAAEQTRKQLQPTRRIPEFSVN
jgi:hypothetical protein